MASFIKFVTKCGIAGGIIYGVASQNIFSSQDRAITSFNHLKSKTQSNIPMEVPQYMQLPSKSDVRKKWNCGVQYVFSSIDKTPGTIMNLISQGMEITKEFVKQQVK